MYNQEREFTEPQCNTCLWQISCTQCTRRLSRQKVPITRSLLLGRPCVIGLNLLELQHKQETHSAQIIFHITIIHPHLTSSTPG